MVLSKVISESVRQATAQLGGNKLRTFLSLLGISIGIFCIIGVLSAVNSLQENVQGSLSKLGNDVVYIDKWPWKDNSGDWWEYFQRPNPSHDDYESLKERLNSDQLAAYWEGQANTGIKWQDNSVEGGYQLFQTPELAELFKMQIDRGRFMTQNEYRNGAYKLVLGHLIAEQLFGGINPIGKEVKMRGRKFEVIGTLKKSDDELINPLDFDEAIIIGYITGTRFVNLDNKGRRGGGQIGVKAREGITDDQLMDEIRGILRSERRLRPREDDNFSLNEIDMLAGPLDAIFGVLNIIGLIIGAFSILVGGISVANIMFVSVKERTSLIGVKKALGAREYVILLEFLIEAIILCVIGGLMGLILIVGVTSIINIFSPFKIVLSVPYAIAGVLLSALIGVLAGAIPARLAAKLDPVEAMRT